MAAPKAMDLKNCTVKFEDGASGSIEILVDEGNIQYTVARNIEVKRNRGLLDYLKEGDQEPMKVQMDIRFDCLKSSSGDPITPHEFLTRTGAGSALVSTQGVCAAYTIDIVVEVDQECGTTVQDELITFEMFAYEEIGGSFKDGTLSVSGICNKVFPTSIRTTFA